jgi:hypothetical protein
MNLFVLRFPLRQLFLFADIIGFGGVFSAARAHEPTLRFFL